MMKRFMIILLLVQIVNSRFLESPTSQTVNVGENAVFRCQHETANFFRWKVNGTLFSPFSMPIPGVTQGSADNHLVSTLTVAGRLDYNETEVVCVAQFDSGMEEEATEGAFLYIGGSGFTETPQPKNVSSGEIATFQCQHSTADSIGWKLNGTLLNVYTPPNTTVISYPLSNGDIVFRLIITAFQHYNTTQIVCIAIFPTEGLGAVESTPVTLLIQGRLDRVTSLGRVTSLQQLLYTWLPPYSLDLTAVMPDVVYCIDVFKITCGVREHVISQCGINNHSYQVSHETLDTADLYEAIVIPRSNTANARNGTPAVTTDQYIRVSDSMWNIVVVNQDESGNMTIQLNVKLNRDDDLKVTPDSFAVLFNTVDNESIDRRSCGSSSFPKSTAVLEELLECLLPPRRLWMATLLVGRCVEEQVSNTKELSTHDIQDIKIVICDANKTYSKGAVIFGDFINGTAATGLLVIMYSQTNDAHIVAIVTPRQPSFRVKISGLNENELYGVSAFIVDEDGLPLESAATLTRSVYTVSNKKTTCDSNEKQTSLITAEMTINSERNETCVHCAIPDDLNVSSCIVVLFDTSTKISPSYMYINVFIFNKTYGHSGIHGCLDDKDLNITRQRVIVFPYINGSIVGSGVILQNESSKERDLDYLLKIVLPSVCVFIIITVVLTSTVIGSCCCWYKRNKRLAVIDHRSENESTATGIEMHKCNAYEHNKIHRKNPIVTEENSAYGVIIRA